MSKPFEIVSAFKPSGDQPAAIKKVVEGINSGLLNQTLKGVLVQEKLSLWRMLFKIFNDRLLSWLIIRL